MKKRQPQVENDNSSNSYRRLQKLAEAVVQPPSSGDNNDDSLGVDGTKVSLFDMGTQQLWKAAPPKMNLTPG